MAPVSQRGGRAVDEFFFFGGGGLLDRLYEMMGWIGLGFGLPGFKEVLLVYFLQS